MGLEQRLLAFGDPFPRDRHQRAHEAVELVLRAVVEGFRRPLVAISRERVAKGQEPLFQSHMWDGSAVPLAENLQVAAELLAECAAARTIMELEIGVVGGEEDGVVGEINEKLYTTP